MWLLFFLSAHVCSICIEYSCKSNYYKLLPNQCIWSYPNQDSYNLSLSLSPCKDLYFSYCPPVTSNASCELPPQKPAVNTAYINEPCTLDINCVSSLCINGTCSGLPENFSCSSDTNCNAGLYCDSTCKVLKGLYSSCMRDLECLNNLTCVNGKCVNYLSLTSYAPLSQCSGQVNLQCFSGGCFSDNGNNYCLPNAKSPYNIPNPCVVDDQCKIPLGGDKFSSYLTSCQCSQNGYGGMTCSLAPGDGIFKSYIGQLKKWFGSKEIHKCHTTQRLSLNCVQVMWDYRNYVTLAYFQSYALNYPQYQYSDTCVKEIFQAPFWALQKAYLSFQAEEEESSSFAGALVYLYSILIIN